MTDTSAHSRSGRSDVIQERSRDGRRITNATTGEMRTRGEGTEATGIRDGTNMTTWTTLNMIAHGLVVSPKEIEIGIGIGIGLILPIDGETTTVTIVDIGPTILDGKTEMTTTEAIAPTMAVTLARTGTDIEDDGSRRVTTGATTAGGIDHAREIGIATGMTIITETEATMAGRIEIGRIRWTSAR